MTSTFRFGNPWHGTYSEAGLTLDNGTLHPEWASPDWSHYTYYVNLGKPAPEPETAVELGAGMDWKNDAVLCGLYRQYGVSPDRLFGDNQWLYQAPDGTQFFIRVVCDPVYFGTAAVSIIPRLAGQGGYGSLSFVAIPYSTNEADWHYYLNASPNGSKCMLNFTRLANATSGGVPYKYQTQCRGLIEFTVTGGSATEAPVTTYEFLYGYQGAALSASSSVTVVDTTTLKTTLILQGGYDVAGNRKILSLASVIVSTNPPNIALSYPWAYRSYSRAERFWEVANNGVAEYTTPAWIKDVTIDHAAPPNDGDTPPADITVSNESAPAWQYADVQARFLSNCLVAFTAWFSPNRSVIHAHSFFGAANSSSLIGALDSALTLAAYNPRSGDVAVGLKGGFI